MSKLKMLRVYNHPKQGNIIITNIEFINESNYMYGWRKVLKDGKVCDEEEMGVGGYWKELKDIVVKLSVVFQEKENKNVAAANK